MQIDGQHLDESEAQMPPQPLQKQEVTADMLLANMSHALRSPLTAIKGYAETLLRLEQCISQQERHEFLQIIKKASDELAVVTDCLLKGARADSGGLRIELVPFLLPGNGSSFPTEMHSAASSLWNTHQGQRSNDAC